MCSSSRLLWPNHPLGEDIGGRAETIMHITRDDLVKHVEDFYRANNMVLVVAGGVDPDDTLSYAEDAFGGLRKGTGPAWPAGGCKRNPSTVCLRNLRTTFKCSSASAAKVFPMLTPIATLSNSSIPR